MKNFRGLVAKKWAGLSSKQKRLTKAAMITTAVLIASAVIVSAYASTIIDDKSDNHPIRLGKNSADNVKKGSDNKPASSNDNDPSKSQNSASSPLGKAQAYPASILNLTNWKLTLPIAAAGTNKPQEIKQPQLTSFILVPYFEAINGAVQFRSPVGGVTTPNSNYSRSELREMTNDGSDEASWSNSSGIHTMTIRQAITHLPAVKQEVVAGQIHDASEYIILIRLNGSNLFVQANGKNVGTLDAAYKLGTQFTVQVIANDGHIRVLYNGAQKADYQKSGSGFYFKAGCYTQSNPSKGDDPNDYGQVVIYDLQITHS